MGGGYINIHTAKNSVKIKATGTANQLILISDCFSLVLRYAAFLKPSKASTCGAKNNKSLIRSDPVPRIWLPITRVIIIFDEKFNILLIIADVISDVTPFLIVDILLKYNC